MTRFIRRRGKQKNETGFILVAAVILVVLIGLLGVVASFLFVSGTTQPKITFCLHGLSMRLKGGWRGESGNILRMAATVEKPIT